MGTGDTESRYSFTKVVSSDVIKIGAGSTSSFILKKDGSVWFTGSNEYGPDIPPSDFKPQTNFIRMIPSGVVDIHVGDYCCVALKNDGSVWTIGYNRNGELANGGHESSSFEKVVESGVSAIATGGSKTFILKEDGSVWACGINYRGDLGLGHNKNFGEYELQRVFEPRSGITIVACGGSSYIIKGDGTVWATGKNENGELGIGTRQNVKIFTQCYDTDGLITSGVNNVFAGGYEFSFILKKNGELWGAGNTGSGRLGKLKSYSNSKFNQCIDEDGELITGVKSVSGGTYHSLLVKNNGDVYVTGSNSYGQLGIGSNNNLSTFTSLSEFESGTISVKNISGNSISLFIIKTGIGTIQSEENIANNSSATFTNIPVGTYTVNAASRRGGLNLPYTWSKIVEVTKESTTTITVDGTGWK